MLTGTATVAQATAIHGLNPASSLATYVLADTAAALAAAPAATVHAASSVTVAGALLAADATTLLGELGLNVHMSYSLADTGAALAAAPAVALSGATSVTITSSVLVPGTTVATLAGIVISNAVTVAEAIIIHNLAPLATYNIVDTGTPLATALSTGDAGLAAVRAAGTVEVFDGINNGTLNLNADQFANLEAAGHPLLSSVDDPDRPSRYRSGAAGGFGNTACFRRHAYGAVGVQTGFTLGQTDGSLSIWTSGETQITMEGAGKHITGATGVAETYFMGVHASGS